MADIVDLLKDKTCGEISCEQCNEERERAEAEIVRLREGLRELRYGIFKDADAVNEFIDKLLKIEETTEF